MRRGNIVGKQILRWRFYLIRPDNLIPDSLLNVIQLHLGYSGMRSGRIEGAKVPEDAPDEADGAAGIEDGSPSEMSDDERAQRVGQSDADAEP